MSKKIFISHSNKDMEYVKIIVEMLEDLGLRDDQIFCSSFAEYGIPNGKDICNYLIEQFNTIELTVLFILSENYYSSVVCLNEMGATWVLKKSSLSFLLPGFNVDKMEGVVNKNQVAIMLDAENMELISRLNEFKESLEDNFGIAKLKTSVWERKRDQFLDKVSKLSQKELLNYSDRIYKRKIIKVDKVNNNKFYLLDEKLPISELAENYVNGETHWLADWNCENDDLLQGKTEIVFCIKKITNLSNYNHNGQLIKNARTITGQIIETI